MIVCDTPKKNDLFQFLSLRSSLKLETLGFKRSGQSAYSIIKQEFGFKGNKKSVLQQMEELIAEMKKSS
jgi:hypothetical protein